VFFSRFQLRLALPFSLPVLLLAAGCAVPRSDLPPDVPDPDDVRVVHDGGYRLCIDGSCLNADETEALFRELSAARERILAFLGGARAPGDFRGYGTTRPECPSLDPLPLPPRIDVVVVREGERCHADSDGITLLQSHLPRRDATHELVHFLAGSSWRPIDEGLAVYLTERIWGPDKTIPVKIRARVFSDLNLRVNLEPAAMRRGMSRRDYDVAGAFVGWLIEAFGPERFWTLYHGPVRDYHSAYGRSESELWGRFWRFVRNLEVRHDASYHRYRDRLTRPRAPARADD